MVTNSPQTSSQGVKSSSPKKGRPVSSKARTRSANGKPSSRRKVKGLTANLYQQGRDVVSGAYDTAAKAGEYVPHMSLKSGRQSVYAMIEERPFVVGAVGIGIGMVLASILPSVSSHRNGR